MMNTYEQKQELESVIIEHIPLIKRIVSRINLKQTEYEREDLLHIGVLGLIEAYKRYDAKKGVPFEHFAKWRIKGSIIDELRKNGRLSRGKMDRINEYYRVQNELQQKLQREPGQRNLLGYVSYPKSCMKFRIIFIIFPSILWRMFVCRTGRSIAHGYYRDKETHRMRVLEKERKEILAQQEKLTEREHGINLIINSFQQDRSSLGDPAQGFTDSRTNPGKIEEANGKRIGRM